MMSADLAAAQIHARRETDAMADLQRKVADASEALDPAVKAADDLIKQQLPDTVQSVVVGDLPYARFKQRYEQVYAQVRDKDHLLSGRVRFETELAGMPVVIRSLRQRDRRALSAWAPDARAEHRVFLNQDFQYRLRLVVLSVEKIGDATFPDPPSTLTDFAAWEKVPAVAQALAYAEDWDETLFGLVLGLLSDLETAKHLALLENLGNP